MRANQVKSGTIGVDMGIKDYIIMSDGTKYVNAKYLEEWRKKLAKLRRRHSLEK